MQSGVYVVFDVEGAVALGSVGSQSGHCQRRLQKKWDCHRKQLAKIAKAGAEYKVVVAGSTTVARMENSAI